ncbi:unnamed protein product [Spirodela intermedia]|uniref:Uncharacterized protein n=2 Tax=Spirodela intermedia TaxID=51605 RepID=A0A7I8J8R8_SPIIN|nr:unnamed protein product [Spirodela intermedia]CAA6666165.1 unnamed protein product [Spirodela intermedia]CAA7402934.1 unnamed protein product [Spirodela intermedia]
MEVRELRPWLPGFPGFFSSSSSSTAFFLAFALGCLLAVAVSVSLRKKDRGLKEEELRLPRLENLADDSSAPPSSASEAPHQRQRLHEWAATASPPLLPLLGGGEGEQERDERKKKKKRGKKKKQESQSGGGSDGGEEPGCGEKDRMEWGGGKLGPGSNYPFSSLLSATQRRIKHQYDQLVKSNQAKALTIAQVGEFANCLTEARNELQHKSEVIQRKFTITKALLFKADRSSFDRLCQQIHKLEAEQKRLEEDAVVYNRLLEQLKLSPAYKTMLEIGARMESEASPEDDDGDPDSESIDVSFEELLAQEKKDSFWQRNGKLRSFSSGAANNRIDPT